MKREGARVGEKLLKFEGEGKSGGILDGEVGNKLDTGEVLVVGEVVNEVLEPVFGVAVFALKSEKNQTPRPNPRGGG